MEDNNKLFSVVIVNWNSGDYLYDCVKSLEKNEPNGNYEIIIVDNNSKDYSLSIIEEKKGIRVVKLDYNAGFAKACNIGAMLSSSKYILFLNPDTRIFYKTISKTIFYLENLKIKNIGIAGIKLLDKDNTISKTCSRFPTVLSIVSKIFNIDNLYPRFTSSLMIEFNGLNTIIVDQVIGAFFLVESDLFKALDGFDERFFVYYEEVDFSFRAMKKGYKSIFISEYSAFHAGGGCSSIDKPKRLFYNIRSKIIYAKKNYSRIGFLIVSFSSLFIEPLTRLIDKIIKINFGEINEVIIAYTNIYRWIISIFLSNIFRCNK